MGKEDDRHLWPEMLRAIREIQPRWIVGENVLGLVNWSDGLVFHEVQTDLEAEGYEVQPFVLPAAAVNAPHRRDRVWFVAYRQDMGFKGTFTQLREGNQDSERASCEHKGRRNDIRPIIDAHGKSWFTPNPNSDGQQRSDSQHEKHAGEGWEYAQRDIEPGIGDGDAADTNNTRLQTFYNQKPKLGEENRTKTFGGNGFESVHTRNGWQTFPTQPPVCDGNDGIPSRLDGITFSKWRQESIKAGGNAVVPQVVYQIFKAIEQYENESNF